MCIRDSLQTLALAVLLARAGINRGRRATASATHRTKIIEAILSEGTRTTRLLAALLPTTLLRVTFSATTLLGVALVASTLRFLTARVLVYFILLRGTTTANLPRLEALRLFLRFTVPAAARTPTRIRSSLASHTSQRPSISE